MQEKMDTHPKVTRRTLFLLATIFTLAFTRCNTDVDLTAPYMSIPVVFGLLDADVYGPSVPIMMNANGRPLIDKNQKIIPIPAHGVSCLSIGMLVDPDQPIIWRGPMVMGALRQFIQDTHWGELDFLLIDLKKNLIFLYHGDQFLFQLKYLQ